MSGAERRTGARFLADFGVVLSALKGGAPIDERAIAHDVSLKGFKVETQAALARGEVVAFALELPSGGRAAGKGRVVWSSREPLATWAGVEIVSMSWGDKLRLNGLLRPDSVDWARLRSLCVTLIAALTLIAAARRIIGDAALRGALPTLVPKIIALLAMGWALAGLLKRERS
ncbi:MAG: PilZ domain-containing protein [Elusimicrobia bacterium]|nr:PilZ domain-containing protein [Elusimicrobiota bacterium]